MVTLSVDDLNDSAGAKVARYTYGALGRRATQTKANGNVVTNGYFPDDGDPSQVRPYVRSDVVGDLAELNAAYAAEFGANLTINSSYRTYAQQEALYDPSSDTAAPPGCSNHGTGLAIDIGGGVQTFGSAQYDWRKAHAGAYGWSTRRSPSRPDATPSRGTGSPSRRPTATDAPAGSAVVCSAPALPAPEPFPRALVQISRRHRSAGR